MFKKDLKQEFIHMITRHQGIIHKVCRIYRDTAEDREDLFQEIVYQLWKSFPSFRAASKVSTWMYKIALSTAIAKFRKNRALQPPTIPLEGIEAEAVPAASQHPEKERLYRAIAQLSTAEKAIITLYLDDYSYEEMAEIMGISANHLGVKINRIKQKLKTLLNPNNHETR